MQTFPSHHSGRSRRRSPWAWLLAVPALAPLAAVVYLDQMSPRLFGLPLFYWGQLALVVVVMCYVVLIRRLIVRG